ncbi:hypothetical protein DPMN_182048 [Dreissena polymorpha]|uniref:NACHT domain-containing protein n=1 Tax=Dreissena polymorpha TaxID=45954 RepID=A0A9D4DFN6_DREPO|nr:hypothetical protein DPMN_182048 [Dreissena polymorpha]
MTEEVLYQRCPSMSENLRGKDEQNWLKCTIAAFTAKDALVKFATDSFTNFYEDVRQTIVNTKGIGKHITCSACTIDKKGQLHTTGKLCPGICSGIRYLIWNNHRFKRTAYIGPSWGNTDSTKWCTNSWELAKCYMPETGYREKDADTTDFNGIISAVYNCTWVETLFADNLNQPDNVCTKARNKVNELRHINRMKISDADMNSFFDSLLNLLDDQIYLHGFAPAVTAHSYLNKLRKNSLLLADSTIIDTVEHMKAELIQEKDESMIAKITSILSNLYENKKDELQKYLIQFYQNHHSSVPLNMLCEEIDIRLEHIHVFPKISELKREKSVEPKSIYSYHDMFFRDTLHSRRIYLQGEAGTGKSTFCTQLTQDWCKSHGADVIQQSKTTATNPNETNKINTQEFSDLDTLRTFRFLFFVSLQSMNGLECDVSEMITRTLGTNWDERFWEDECLIVRDSADEWNHPKIDGKTCKCTNDRQLPPEKVMGNVTFLTTSRPWKLANAKLSDTMTRTFEIYGVSDADSLIERVLTAHGKTESHIIEFKNIVLKYKLKESMRTPVIAMQLIHQYISGYALTSSRCVIYTNLLDMHVARALSKQNLESFDKDQTVCPPLPDLLKQRDLCLNKNSATIYELSNLAFHELLSREHISDIVFSEEQIALFVKTGIVTQRKSLALNPPKRNAYTFQHKTVQEFLAAVYVFMKSKSQDSNDPMEQVLCQIKQTYHSKYNIYGLQQIFIFTCGLYPEAAERLYQHIMDIATVDSVENLKKSFLKNKKPAAVRLNTLEFVTHLILDGISEGRASKQTSLRLNLTYVNDNDFLKEDSNPLETDLIDLNKDNMSIVCSSQRPLVPIKHLLECFSQTITVLMLNRYTSHVGYDLSGLIHLQFLYLSNNITISNIGARNLIGCSLENVTSETENNVLNTAQRNWKDSLEYFYIKGCRNTELFVQMIGNIKNLKSLHFGKFSQIHRIIRNHDTVIDLSKVVCCSLHVDPFIESTILRFLFHAGSNFTLLKIKSCKNEQRLLAELPKSSPTENVQKLNTKDLEECTLIHVDPLIESAILQSLLLQTGNNLRRLVIKGCKNEKLLLSALPNMSSLHSLDAVCGDTNSDDAMFKGEELSSKEKNRSFSFSNFTLSELLLTTLTQIQNIQILTIRNTEQTNTQCGSNKSKTIEHMHKINTKDLEYCTLIHVDPLIESAILQSLLQTGNSIKRLVIKGCTNEELLLSALPNLSSLDYLDAMCIDTYSAMLKKDEDKHSFFKEKLSFLKYKLSLLKKEQLSSFRFCNFTLSELLLTTLSQIQRIQKLKIQNTKQTNAQCRANKSRTTEHMPNLNTKDLEECILIHVDPLIESTILQSFLQAGNNLRRLVIKGCNNEELLLSALPNMSSLHSLDANFTLSELLLTTLTQIQNIQILTIKNTEQTNTQCGSNKSKTREHMHKINTKDLEYCTLIHVDPLIESTILQSFLQAGNNLRRLLIKGCNNEELLLSALPNMSSLHSLDAVCGDTNSAMFKWEELSSKEKFRSFSFSNFTLSELLLTTLTQIQNIQILTIRNTEQTNTQCGSNKSKTIEHMHKINTKDLEYCTLIHVDPLIESAILQSLLQTGNSIKRLVIKGCTNEELLLSALPNLSSLDYLDAMCIDTYSAMLKKDEDKHSFFKEKLSFLKYKLSLLKKEQLSSFRFCNFTLSELLLTTLSQIQRIQKLKIQNTEQTNAQCRANKSRTTEHMPNLNTKDLEECILIHVDPLIESTILQSFLQAGNNLRRLVIKGCNNEELFLDAFPFTIIK